MRLVRYVSLGEPRTGVLVGRWIADIAGILDQDPMDLAELLALGGDGMAMAARVEGIVKGSSDEEREGLASQGRLLAIDDVTFAPPLSAANALYCVGRNYADHVSEIGAGMPEAPGIFLRLPRSVVGHGQPLVRPIPVSTQLDFEGELAAVIGRPCHRVSPMDALDYVAGYTVFNDGSVRDYQKRMSAFLTPGKNFDRSGSLGPWVVTSDEIPDVQALRLHTTLNGESMQAASTSEMIFDVATLISHISEFDCLRPGDVIATGTPAGIGFRREPPRFLVPGDKLAIEIEGIGVLENHVVDEVPPGDR